MGMVATGLGGRDGDPPWGGDEGKPGRGIRKGDPGEEVGKEREPQERKVGDPRGWDGFL